MTQRNPMNERYTSEERSGKSRKSAASAKPKTKAAASVRVESTQKTPQQKKAAAKAERKREQNKQRELDRKYYTPDTPRYKKLRRIWWVCLIGAILCTVLSWFTRGIEPAWIPMIPLFGAYALIIAAFYIDLSKIRKERTKYQQRMIEQEEKDKKAAKAAARAERQAQSQQKGSGKNQNRNAKPKQGDTVVNAAKESPVVEEPKKRGLFGGFRSSKVKEEKARVQAAQQAATDKAVAEKNN